MSDVANSAMALTGRSHRDAVQLVLRAARDELGLELEFVATVEAARPGDSADPAGSPVVTVPIVCSDGTSFGFLQARMTADGERLREHSDVVRVLARVVAAHLEAADREAHAHRAVIEHTAVRALVVALETRDGYTGWHSESVLKLCVAVGEQLGLGPAEITSTEQVALLHDVGKIGVPDAILQKPGPLDEREWEVMKRHPSIGADMVRSVADLGHLAPAIAAEHERWDGGGYPRGLAGEAIPIESRIVLVCDAYHAMISQRPYRQPIPLAAALREIKDHAGTQFCPQSAHALLAVADLDDLAGSYTSEPA